MAKKKLQKNIIDTIKRYRKTIEDSGVPVESMIVFGSYAKGTMHKDSDIDVCVVSKKFGKDPIDEMQWLFKQTWGIDTRIEPYPTNKKGLSFKTNPIISEILKYGILV